MIKIDYFCFANPSRFLNIQDNVGAFNQCIIKDKSGSDPGLPISPIFSPLQKEELSLVDCDFRESLKLFVSHFGDEVLPELWSRGCPADIEEQIVEREIRKGDHCLAKTPQGNLLRGYIKKIERRRKFAHIAFYEKDYIHLVQFDNLRYLTAADDDRTNLLKTISAKMSKWGIDAIKLDLSSPPRSRYVTFRKTKFGNWADNGPKTLNKENWRASRQDEYYNSQNNAKFDRFSHLRRAFPPPPLADPNINLSLLRAVNIIEQRDGSHSPPLIRAGSNGAWRDLRPSCDSCYRKEKTEGVANLKWSKWGRLCERCFAKSEKESQLVQG